jgi:hypothetical protein
VADNSKSDEQANDDKASNPCTHPLFLPAERTRLGNGAYLLTAFLARA